MAGETSSGIRNQKLTPANETETEAGKFLCCDQCEFRTERKNAKKYQSHLKKHYKRGKFKCIFCSFSALTEFAVQRHLAGDHSESRQSMPVEPSGNKTFTGNAARNETNKAATEGTSASDFIEEGRQQKKAEQHNKPCLEEAIIPKDSLPSYYQCPFCTFFARSVTFFREHLAKQHKGHFNEAEPFTCSHCRLQFKQKAAIVRHIKQIPTDHTGAEVEITEEFSDAALQKYFITMTESLENQGQASEQTASTSQQLRTTKPSSSNAESRKRASRSCRELYESDTDTELEDFEPTATSVRNLRSGKKPAKRQTREMRSSVVCLNEGSPVLKSSVEAYYCSPCSYASVELAHFHEHMVAHSRKRHFGCNKCGQRFTVRNATESHINKCHKDAAAVLLAPMDPVAYEKDKKVVSVTEFSKSQAVQQYSEPLPLVEEAEFVARFESSSTIAKKSVSKGAGPSTVAKSFAYVCPACEFKADSRKLLRSHFKNHSGKVVFRCSACSFCSPIRFRVNKHIDKAKSSDPSHQSASTKDLQLSKLRDCNIFRQNVSPASEKVTVIKESEPQPELQPEKQPEPQPEKQTPSESITSNDSDATSPTCVLSPLHLEASSENDTEEEACAVQCFQTPAAESKNNQNVAENAVQAADQKPVAPATSLRMIRKDTLHTAASCMDKNPKTEGPPLLPSENSNSPNAVSSEWENIAEESDEQLNTQSVGENPPLEEVSDHLEKADNVPSSVEKEPEKDPVRLMHEKGPEELSDPPTSQTAAVAEPRPLADPLVVTIKDEEDDDVQVVSTTQPQPTITVRSFARETVCETTVGSTSETPEVVENEYFNSALSSVSEEYYELQSKEAEISGQIKQARERAAQIKRDIAVIEESKNREANDLRNNQNLVEEERRAFEDLRKARENVVKDLEDCRTQVEQLSQSVWQQRSRKLHTEYRIRTEQANICREKMEALTTSDAQEKRRRMEQLDRRDQEMLQTESTIRDIVKLIEELQEKISVINEKITEGEKQRTELEERFRNTEAALREAGLKVFNSRKNLSDLESELQQQKNAEAAALLELIRLEKELHQKGLEKLKCLEDHLKNQAGTSAAVEQTSSGGPSTAQQEAQPPPGGTHPILTQMARTVDAINAERQSPASSANFGQQQVAPHPTTVAQIPQHSVGQLQFRHQRTSPLASQDPTPYFVVHRPVSLDALGQPGTNLAVPPQFSVRNSHPRMTAALRSSPRQRTPSAASRSRGPRLAVVHRPPSQSSQGPLPSYHESRPQNLVINNNNTTYGLVIQGQQATSVNAAAQQSHNFSLPLLNGLILSYDPSLVQGGNNSGQSNQSF